MIEGRGRSKKRNKCKRHSIVLIGLSLLFGILFPACSIPPESTDFVTYENDTWGYAVSYPGDWSVEFVDSNTTEIRSPYPRFAHVEIYADKSFGLPIRTEGRIWLEGTMEANLYRVSPEAEKEGYSDYPFEGVISTFALPAE